MSQYDQVDFGETIIPRATLLPLNADLRTIIRAFNDHTIYLNNQIVEDRDEILNIINVKDNFGAKGDGVTDDTSAINAAVAVAATHSALGNQAVLYFSAGTYLHTGLVFTNLMGVTIRGEGQWNTIIKYNGSGGTAVRFVNARECSVENIAIYGITGGAKPDILVEMQRDSTTGSFVPSRNFFWRVRFGGLSNDAGIDLAYTKAAGSTDSNNDLSTHLHCTFANFDVAGVSLEHSQSKAHLFLGCTCSGISIASGAVGLSTWQELNQGGSFNWYGGGMDNCAVCFDLGGPDDTILISGCEVESIARFLTVSGTAGGTGAAWPITVQGCRVACNSLHADTYLISSASPGPLILIGNAFGEVDVAIPKIRMRAGNQNVLTAIANHFGSIGSHLVDPFVFDSNGFANRLVQYGNTYWDGAQTVSRGDTLGEFYTYTMPPPSVITPVEGAGGSLTAGTKKYRITGTTATGETLASTTQTIVVGANSTVTLGWKRLFRATGYKVYASYDADPEELIATIGSGATLTYLDDGTVPPSGALPATNTAVFHGFGGLVVARAVVPTGSTTNDLITAMQNLGLITQS